MVFPDAPWITNYERYRNDYYYLTDEPPEEEEDDEDTDGEE